MSWHLTFEYKPLRMRLVTGSQDLHMRSILISNVTCYDIFYVLIALKLAFRGSSAQTVDRTVIIILCDRTMKKKIMEEEIIIEAHFI